MTLRALLFSTASMVVLSGFSALLGGCANTTTTKIYRDGHGAWIVESPKDIHAKGIDLTTPQGTRLKVEDWESRANPSVTSAQGQREASDIDASSTLVGAAVSAAVRSQMETPAK